MADTARVYIIEAVFCADRPYDYFIPPEYSDRIEPGMIIEVPFGRGNRKMTAAVYDVFDRTGDDGGKEIKPIFPPGDSAGPVLSREALELCMFLKNYTLCTFGDAVRTVVPAAALSRIEETYSVPEGDPAKEVRNLNEKASFVLAAIKARDRVSKEYLRSEFGEDVSAILSSLLKHGLIEKRSSLREGGKNVRQVNVLYPSEDIAARAAEDPSFIDGYASEMKSRRQAAVLKAAVASPGVTDRQIAEAEDLDVAVVRVAVSALKKKNLIRAEKRDVMRDPLMPDEKDFSSYAGEDSLSREQQGAYETLESLYKDDVPRAALLHGVTGSGKTNVIMKLISRVIEDGKGVIMLVPEIALTPQTVGRFVARFGDRVAVIHSGLSAGERYDAWRRLRDGDADIAIGTRSAVFAPVPNIGLIVIDEEHEHTYKSETSPKYLAHDVARFRCGEHRAMMLLASATPSLTSYYKAKQGKYTLVELKERFGGAVLPEVELADLKEELSSGNTSPLSRALIRRMSEGFSRGEQAILFLNRRGYNNFISCRGCGETVKCPNCSVTLTYHVKDRALMRGAGRDSNYLEVRRGAGYLECHLCGHRESVPARCPDCGSEHFLFLGCGTQLVEDHLTRMFPSARVLRMDHDTTRTKNSHEELLSKFRKGGADVLLGTQMVTKGHDFPDVTTVGVLNADSSMFADDYRAAERTFAMLTQVVGRAGRGKSPGVSVIQTANPDSEVLSLAAKQDYKTFYEKEIKLRRALVFPPFCDIAVITLSGTDESFLERSAARFKERMLEHLRRDYSGVKTVIYGPFEAPIYKIQNVCRLRFVIKCRLDRRTREFLSVMLTEFTRGGQGRTLKNLKVSVDLNPTSV
ncbi:MAG: primosomal protein N' [Clostridia bacterium]|nr:primosomal protein N' [Clostridia bacterium]